MKNIDHDIVIIGSGIAGSSLAAILARNGLDVLMIEAKEHPRFAIGESMILETSEMMRSLAELYDVPEIAYFSSENYLNKIGSSHGVKRHFGFLHHTEGQLQDPDQTLQAVIPKEPHGHELHLYRQDSDYFLMQAAVKYGAKIYQNEVVVDVDFDAEYPLIQLKSGKQIAARYVVDASGFRSPLAHKFGIRHKGLETESRGIFTHMIDVPAFEHLGSVDPQALPFPMAEGTLHHVFDGGWLWVIPFNNHEQSTNPICSVGLMLDPRKFPENREISAEEEFFQFLSRFPEIERQLRQGKAVRPWVRAPRIQYGATQVVGDRWALLGHAAGFVDPLFSKGLYVSLTMVSMLSHLILKENEADRFSRQAFIQLEHLTQAYLKRNDRLIASAYRSFQHPELWRRYSVLWLLGAYTEYLRLNMIRSQAHGNRSYYYRQLTQLSLVGGGFEEFRILSDRIDRIIERHSRLNDPVKMDETIAQIDTLLRAIQWMPKPFVDILNGAPALPRQKIRLDLFKRGGGFLGNGRYREHFFGTQSVWTLLRVYLAEKLKYGKVPLLLEPR